MTETTAGNSNEGGFSCILPQNTQTNATLQFGLKLKGANDAVYKMLYSGCKIFIYVRRTRPGGRHTMAYLTRGC